MSNNKWAKIVAFIALFMIVFSVFWSGILYLYQSNKNSSSNNLSESQLNELLKWFSWANTLTWWIELKSNWTWTVLDVTDLTKTWVTNN